MKGLIVFPVCLLLWVMPTVCLAQSAYLHSSEIIEGDIATLVVEYHNNMPSLFYLDTSPLEASFQVLDVRPNVRNERVNNKIFNTMRWEVQIYPRKTGIIRIPPLIIKGISTPELSLKVIDKASIKDSGERIFVTVRVDPEDPRIGEQIIVTIRLIHNKLLASGQLSEPKIKQGNIYRIGRDRHFDETIDGEIFGIIERKLALFADFPGSLVYPAVEFRGEIENDEINPAHEHRFKRRIKRDSLPVILDIQPKVAGYIGKHWLPAAEIEVSQQWYGLDGDLTTGDSLGRSLTIQADGLPAAALPENLFNLSNANFTVYPDKAQKENGVVSDRLNSRLDQAHAIVITGQGKITIPDINLSWWDTDEEIEKVVTLPGKTIMVSPPIITAVNKKPDLTGKRVADSDRLILLKQRFATNWHWILAVVACALILIVYWYAARVKLKQKPILENRFSCRRFKKACFSGDKFTARAQLIALAREQWPGESIAGLNLLKSRSSSVNFSQQLACLDAVLYAQDQDQWQSRQLWQAFVEAGSQKCKRTPNISTNLPNLYPL